VLKTNLKRLPAAVERAITEARERRLQRRTQLELDLARERLTGILNTLQDMLWSVDARGERVLFASPAALHVFGRPAEIFQDDVHQFAKLAHPDDRPRLELAWTRLLAGASLDIEYRSQWPNGGVRWINQRARVIRAADGTIERIDGIARDVTEQAEQRQRIRHLALYDQLTGLPNRTQFRERLSEELQHAVLAKPGFAVALFDLERFNAINDVFGPEVGNEVLKALAARWRTVSPQTDSVARVGGDLFGVKYFGVSGAAGVEPLIERAWESVFGAPFQVLGQEVRLSAKAGVAMFPRDGTDADTLFRNAEAALRHAKQAGERRAFYAPEINAWVAERVSLENRLRKAVENGELFFQYQPKLELATRRVVGVEALMRWNGPDGKPVSPAKFIPILEQTGLIVEAGRQALVAANRTYRAWQARGLRAPRVAVNVSALQLRRLSFIADLRAALADLADDGGGVDVEVTESLLMSDVEQTTRKLNELRAMGLHIALDDFGTGYSSLAYLSRLPIDTLKIDRAFVRGMTEHRTDLSIITSIVSLAQALQIHLVAEGVETQEQAERLLKLGCQQAQGFLFSPPVAVERLEPLLKRQ